VIEQNRNLWGELMNPILERDDPAPYEMPEFRGRNIVVFSDGTGQAGGLLVDEHRSNVYKLYRATRCGPENVIDPDQQIAIYDPGLGSALAGEEIRFGLFRRIYNAISSATGLGITRNIVDCYATLIQVWRPGDRIFLFGFSRGAYTVRCLGGVLGLCGIPTRDGEQPLVRDQATARRIAWEAVKRVYQHGSGVGGKTDAQKARKARLGLQRRALGEQFRGRYMSSDETGLSNAVPHFIGVWDTVAAVGLSPPALRIARIAAGGIACLLAAAGAWLMVKETGASFLMWWAGLLAASALALVAVYYWLRLKSAPNLPGYPWRETVHLTSFKMAFFDQDLNDRVRYARHAISIDERRRDFDRVAWANKNTPPPRAPAEGEWLKQIWFSGNHSDIGGSYPENESRLSDIALHWMTIEAVNAGLLVDERFLNRYGRHHGMQHDECKTGVMIFGWRFQWPEKPRKIPIDAIVHESVARRFTETSVSNLGTDELYRPAALAGHRAFAVHYNAPAATMTA
jgi:uncharacterized protein (DUF2235 family)